MTGAIVIDTPSGIDHVQNLAMTGRLKIEIETGLKFRLSTLAAVNRKFGTNFRTKRRALTFMEEQLLAYFMDGEPS